MAKKKGGKSTMSTLEELREKQRTTTSILELLELGKEIARHPDTKAAVAKEQVELLEAQAKQLEVREKAITAMTDRIVQAIVKAVTPERAKDMGILGFTFTYADGLNPILPTAPKTRVKGKAKVTSAAGAVPRSEEIILMPGCPPDLVGKFRDAQQVADTIPGKTSEHRNAVYNAHQALVGWYMTTITNAAHLAAAQAEINTPQENDQA